GGYVGVGVSTTNLAGRTLADLILGRDSDLTRLPWVNRRPRRWEPEPLRWLGVHGLYAALAAADRAEAQGRRPPLPARLMRALVGH
ncbi:MAG: FAD-dependent oxidoreductase, partial [Rhodobacterales bacterium]|nr:FAD-dependent oxidoreductase [Rhodobacterales bacterium]